jgi:tetratricopeptide (TPR) repeat protein
LFACWGDYFKSGIIIMSSQDASVALEHLSSLYHLRQNNEFGCRLQQRALEMRHMPELGTLADCLDEVDDSVEHEHVKWEKYGLQLRQVDEQVMPVAVQSMLSIADMHKARGRLDEAIRVMERVVEMEEQRCGPLDARLVPILLRYASYVDDAGHHHEAQAIRVRAAELKDLRLLPSALKPPPN